MPRLTLAVLILSAALAGCSLFGREYGGGTPSGPMTAPQVAELLHDQGYTDLAGLHYDGKQWTAAATRNGEPVQVHVDQYGIIHIQ